MKRKPIPDVDVLAIERRLRLQAERPACCCGRKAEVWTQTEEPYCPRCFNRATRK